MICYHQNIEKRDIGRGIHMQLFGSGENMNVLHWDFADKAATAPHQHPEEQFGYVIKGGFQMTLGDETFMIQAGDGYFVPSNVKHSFVAIGDTEAIDVFSPLRRDLPRF